MPEYIERQALRNNLFSLTRYEGNAQALDMCEHIINETTAADVAPVVQANWVVIPTGQGEEYECTACKKRGSGKNYCPYCGARMGQNQTTPGRTLPDFIVPVEENSNRCVSCGEIIPEGRQVCPKCEDS